MRIAVLLTFFCHAAVAQQANAPQANIEGTIVDATTQQPLPGVHLAMFSLVQGMPGEAYGAQSDKAGHFSINPVKAATYVVVPQKPGFVALPGGNTSLTLKSAETRTDLKVEMTPVAVVSGTVTDEFGEPVQRVQISAAPVAAQAAQPVTGRGLSGMTDERGQFRLHGAPGKYYLSATGNPPFQGGLPEIRTDGTRTPTWAITWYPSVSDKAGAAVIDAKPGKELTGIDIRLVAQRSLSVQGTVSGVSLNPGQRVSVTLWANGEQQMIRDVKFSQTDAEGKFTITGLGPGQYNLLARFDDQGTAWQSAPQPVRLDSSDLTGIDVRLNKGQELTGTLQGLTSAKPTVVLQPVLPMQLSFGVSGRPATVAPDGTFHVTGVFPGKNKIIVAPLPENSYVKSVRLDATEYTDGTLEIPPGSVGARLKIVVSDKAATLEGAVLTSDGKPLTDAPILYVMLAASPDDLGFQNAKQATAEHYSFKGIRPGKYRLLVLNPLQTNIADGLRLLYDKAEQIEIKEGDRLNHDLKLPEVLHAK
jgi:hypothetical protein